MLKRAIRISASLILFFYSSFVFSQDLVNLGLTTSDGLNLQRLILSDSGSIDLDIARPVFSFELNGRYRESDDVNTGLAGTRFILHYEESLRVTFASFGSSGTGWRGEVTFENEGFDTLVIANVLPCGANRENVYITGDGPLDLARAWLLRPGYQPLRVILPDNAWEAGYASFEL
ncbi:MAG: hypothetical protein QNK33_01735, partial [Bacteroidales bacterium]|nr:hypothetical protein [Bacteroidales bacterium]